MARYTQHYVLKGRDPVAVGDVLDWARCFVSSERRVGFTELDGGISVSTVFLGLDHQWGNGPPLLFETMIFGGENDGWQDRYSTWDEAEAGHARAVAIAKGELEPE